VNGRDSGEGLGRSLPPDEEAAPSTQVSAFTMPVWAGDVARWSWLIIGVVIVLVVAFLVMAATRLLVFAALFAVLIGGTFLPIVDWLARHHLKRWMAAFLVVLLLIGLAVLIGLVIVYGLVNQLPEVQQKLDAAAQSIKSTLSSTSLPESTVDDVKAGLQSAAKNLASGALGTIGTLVSSVGSLLFGLFISINILVWVLIQGREIGAWASRHVPPVPQPVAYHIFANSARFFRGYIYGSTIVGVFNGAVLGVGALIFGVPMAATIAIVAWVMNYIPYFGAIISGVFTVLLAWGAGGPSMAIPMLVLVFIANGFLQTLVSQFALGSALNLHPLAVLFATTAGGLVAGAIGGVFAAPFLKIGLDAYQSIKDAGVFRAQPATPPPASALRATPAAGPPAGPPGAAPEPGDDQASGGDQG
jgi:putative heme transporter